MLEEPLDVFLMNCRILSAIQKLEEEEARKVERQIRNG